MARRLAPTLLALLLATAIALRWISLGKESLWFDEGMTWWLASLRPTEMIRVIRGDVAAPVYFLLLHAWEFPFGDSDFSMRAMSALFATLSLVPFYVVARTALRSNVARFVALALFAVSFMQVQYAKEARYYALMSFLAMTALACLPVLASRRSWSLIGVFVFCGAVGMYTHSMMMFTLVGLNIAWLLWPGTGSFRQRFVDMLTANAIIGVCYLPWLPTLIQQTKWMTGTFWAERPGSFALGLTISAISGVDVYTIPGFVWNVFGWHWNAPLVAAMVAAVLVIGIREAFFAQNRDGRLSTLALMAYTFGPVFLVFIYSQIRQPIFLERVLIASSAAMPILIAKILDTARRDWSSRAIGISVSACIGVMGIVSTATLLTQERKEDWRGAYASIAQLPPSRSRLLVFVANEGELPFAYYAAHDASRRAEPRTGTPGGFLDWDPPKTIRRVVVDADLDSLRAQMTSGKWNEIVLIQSHESFSDPKGLTEKELRSKWNTIDDKPLRLVRVTRFKP